MKSKLKLQITGKNRAGIAALILLGGGGFLVFLMMFSITQGAAQIPMSMVIDTFTAFEPDNSKHLLVYNMRLPRVIAAALVGSALAVSGALMQGMTRNPLADSGLMGLNSGAALALVLCFAYFKGADYTQIVLASFTGAGLGALAVFSISSLVPGGDGPMKLVLAGATVSTLLSALTQGIAITFKLSQNISFWTMGSVSGTSWSQIKTAAPVLGIALLLSIALSRNISVLSMGEEVAQGLGLKTGFTRFAGAFLVVLLAGTSVALAGSISFLGMLIPHFTRFLVGPDYRLVIPVSGVLGALLLVAADIGSKTLHPPAEIPVGAIIALLGVPVFLYFAKKQKGTA